MLNEWLLIVLKSTGSIIAATYGVYATLTDFREQKDGKRVLSRKGYLGIALLLVSAILSLSTTAIKDYKDKVDRDVRQASEAEKRKADLKRIGEIVDGLGTVKVQLGEAGQTLQATSKATRGISEDLGTQLRLSDLMSTRLTNTATTLLRTSVATSTLLRESTENVSFIDVTVEFSIDPAEIKDENGQPLVSADLLRDFKQGAQNESEMVKQLNTKSSVVRNRIAQGFTLMSYLRKETEKRENRFFPPLKQLDFFSGNDRMVFFVIADTSSFTNDSGIICALTYRSTPNRFAGIRTYKDLNGLTWGLELQVGSEVSNVLKPLFVMLDVGQVDLLENRRVLMLASKGFQPTVSLSATSELKNWGDGKLNGELIVPIGFF